MSTDLSIPTTNDYWTDEIATLKAALDDKCAELDNVLYQFRHLGETTAGITGLMNDFQSERDDARESRDQYAARLDSMRDERDEALTRVQELEAEVRELRGQA